MSDSKKEQHNFDDLKAEYDAKLEKRDALLKKAAELDIANQNMEYLMVSKYAQLAEFNNVNIPKRNQLFNDTINCHKALLTAVNFNNQHRSHLTALIITKISNMKQEAELIKINTAKNEMEAHQLQATITELKKQSKLPQKHDETEITKIKALHFVAEQRQAELKKREQDEKELLKATKLNFIQVQDELQPLKQKYAEDDDTKNELESLREKEKEIVQQKVKSQVEIEVLRKEFNIVTENSNAHEVTSKIAVEKLQTEKDNLLAEQQALRLDNDIAIANLKSELTKVSSANDVENEVAHNSMFLEHQPSQNSVRGDTSNGMQSNRYLQSSQKQAEIPKFTLKVYATPQNGQASSSNSSRLDLLPVVSVVQTPQQQQEEEISRKFS